VGIRNSKKRYVLEQDVWGENLKKVTNEREEMKLIFE
jgi:hypothetical protein